jgi:hypothetical protein
MDDFKSDLVIRVLATVWAGLAVGLIVGDWSHALLVSGIAAAGIVVLTALAWRPPADDVAGHWEDLSWRQRRTVTRALWTGSDPADQRLARVTARARADLTPKESSRHPGLSLAGRTATAAAVVVLAAFAGAPPGWVVAAGLFPVALAVLGLAQLRASPRTA